MENPEGKIIEAIRSINPEDAQKLTKLTLTEEQWERLFGKDESYDPNNIFYGEPEEETAEGTLFKRIYDKSGRYYVGGFTGIRVENK